jgi:hypothetical protein
MEITDMSIPEVASTEKLPRCHCRVFAAWMRTKVSGAIQRMGHDMACKIFRRVEAPLASRLLTPISMAVDPPMAPKGCLV